MKTRIKTVVDLDNQWDRIKESQRKSNVFGVGVGKPLEVYINMRNNLMKQVVIAANNGDYKTANSILGKGAELKITKKLWVKEGPRLNRALQKLNTNKKVSEILESIPVKNWYVGKTDALQAFNGGMTMRKSDIERVKKALKKVGCRAEVANNKIIDIMNIE